MNWSLEDERELWADICQKNLWWFCVVAMGMEHYPKAHRWFHEYIQKPLCDWLEWHGREWLANRADPTKDPQQTRLAVLLPREFGKTSITQAFLLWLHVNDPDLAAAIGSVTTSLAQKLLAPIKTIINGEEKHAWFTWLYGNWFSKDRKWRDEFFVHAARRAVARQDYSYNTWGVATGMVGGHPDILDFDDPISYEAIEADMNWLEKVNAHVANMGPVTRADALMLWPGTRYGENDHFGTEFDSFGIKTLTGMKHPTRAARPDGTWHVYYMSARDLDDCPPEHPKGRPTFPEQWPEWRLQQEEKRDPQKYAAQLLNDPTLSEHNPIQQWQIDECYVDDKDIPYNILYYSMHFDVAFKYENRKNRGDDTVIQIWGHQLGTGRVYYIEGYGNNQWRAEQFYDKAASLLDEYRNKRRKIFVVTAEQEPGGLKGSINNALVNALRERNVPIGFRYEMLSRAGKDKGRRLVDQCAFWVNGFVRLRRGAPGVDILAKQMAKLQAILVGGGHDDWIDCAADVFHPKVYRPLYRIGPAESQVGLAQPYDEELKGPTSTEIYDAYWATKEEESYPTI